MQDTSNCSQGVMDSALQVPVTSGEKKMDYFRRIMLVVKIFTHTLMSKICLDSLGMRGSCSSTSHGFG